MVLHKHGVHTCSAAHNTAAIESLCTIDNKTAAPSTVLLHPIYLHACCSCPQALVTRSNADASQPTLLQDWSADEFVAVVGTIKGLRAEAAVSASAWLLEGLGTYWPQYQDKLTATVGDTRPQQGEPAREQDSRRQAPT